MGAISTSRAENGDVSDDENDKYHGAEKGNQRMETTAQTN